ncbi:uncharacterized protein DUF2493 [Pseudomonas duriflava]|uniref:Uncharacterized protein DUF2493 n=1 Tax=Pseudomonas duriflava TaxID=459528 RepID=A0A562QAE8_9PSED|nr:DUF2493 domain-containing protein [Pseudomonas duriflava]TWI53735.1 uncharacterized protein DUF2493 [Pseudomonas duriflava]
MRLIVCGGRHFNDQEFVFAALNAVMTRKGIEMIIHGGSTPVDRWAEAWAHEHGIKAIAVPAKLHLFGPRAFPLRVTSMLRLHPDGVVAFPGSEGTESLVQQAQAAGVKVWRPRKQAFAEVSH